MMSPVLARQNIDTKISLAANPAFGKKRENYGIKFGD
jgi:hypothetical protein